MKWSQIWKKFKKEREKEKNEKNDNEERERKINSLYFFLLLQSGMKS